MGLIKNVKTLLSTPAMIAPLVRWSLRGIGIAIKVKQPLGGSLQGFRSFSEYWGTINLVPPSCEIAYIQKFAGYSGVIIDVGANLGCMALTLSHARSELNVYCFEPSPETFSILKNNIVYNETLKVYPYQQALGALPGKFTFLNDPDSSATNKLVIDTQNCEHPVIEVDVITIDVFLAALAVNEVAFLKIDVEGYEADVIKGACNLLREGRCKAALVELCPGNLTSAGSSIAHLIETVDFAGQKLYYLNEDGSLGVEVTCENAASVVLTNVAMLSR